MLSDIFLHTSLLNREQVLGLSNCRTTACQDTAQVPLSTYCILNLSPGCRILSSQGLHQRCSSFRLWHLSCSVFVFANTTAPLQISISTSPTPTMLPYRQSCQTGTAHLQLISLFRIRNVCFWCCIFVIQAFHYISPAQP